MSAKRRENKKHRIKRVRMSETDVLHVHHPRHVSPAIVPRADKAVIEIAPIPKAAIKRRTLWEVLFG